MVKDPGLSTPHRYEVPIWRTRTASCAQDVPCERAPALMRLGWSIGAEWEAPGVTASVQTLRASDCSR